MSRMSRISIAKAHHSPAEIEDAAVIAVRVETVARVEIAADAVDVRVVVDVEGAVDAMVAAAVVADGMAVAMAGTPGDGTRSGTWPSFGQEFSSICTDFNSKHFELRLASQLFSGSTLFACPRRDGSPRRWAEGGEFDSVVVRRS